MLFLSLSTAATTEKEDIPIKRNDALSPSHEYANNGSTPAYRLFTTLSYATKALFGLAILALVVLTMAGFYYVYHPEECPLTDMQLIVVSVVWLALAFGSGHIYGLSLRLETKTLCAYGDIGLEDCR